MTFFAVLVVLAAGADCREQAAKNAPGFKKAREAYEKARRAADLAAGAPEDTNRERGWKKARRERRATLPWKEFLKQSDDTDLMVAVGLAVELGLRDGKTLAPLEDELFVLWRSDAEVGNGGFEQLFANQTGDYAAQMRDVLARRGFKEHLALFECALAAYPASKPSENGDERKAQLKKIDVAYFAPLNEAWVELTPLMAQGARVIRANPDAYPLAKAQHRGK
ncbi:MAG: DMP19 family protein [Archangium sp.]